MPAIMNEKMKTKINSRSFILTLSILLLPLFVSFLVMPQVRFALRPDTQLQARKNVAQALYHDDHLTDMRKLWEHRTRIDSGAYTVFHTQPSHIMTFPKDMQNVMSCIDLHSPDAQMFGHYKGNTWQSFDYLIPEDSLRRSMKECLGYTGQEIAQDFRSSTQSGFVLIATRSQAILKETVGLLDYNETDKARVGSNLWLSATFISLN